MKEQIEWKVGCGDKIRFWEDKWTAGDRPLTKRFPSLYQISNQKQQTISLLGSHKDEGWEWCFNWRRNLFDSEVSMATDFLEEIRSSSVQ